MINLASSVHIIYASTGGNTEYVMELVAKRWRDRGVQVELHRSEQTPVSVIKDNQLFLLATSTWDHGTINPFFDKLLAEMQHTDFSGKIAAFIGLGDRRYEKHYFCAGMTLLKEVWEKNQGRSVGVALTIGREPYEDVIEKMVLKWADDTLLFYQNPSQLTQPNQSTAETTPAPDVQKPTQPPTGGPTS